MLKCAELAPGALDAERFGRRTDCELADTEPASIRQYLEGTGQSAEVPTLAPVRDPPQIDLDFEL